MSRIAQVVWLASSLVCSNLVAQTEIRWVPDLAIARRAAAQFQVPLLIHFYGDNCLPCKTLEQRVYSQDAVAKTLNKYFICVRINASQDRAAAAEFQVHSWPTDVFVSPDGQTLYQAVSKQDIGGYMEVLQNVAVLNRDRNTMLAAQRESQSLAPNQVASGQTAAQSAVQSAASTGTLPPTQSQFTSSSPSNNPTTGMQATGTAAAAPASIAGSVPASQMQLAPPTKPEMMPSGTGLPPLPSQLVSQPLGSDGLGSRNISAQLNAQPNVATVSAAASTAQKSSLAATQASLVSNPHYLDSEPMVCTPDGKCGPASTMTTMNGVASNASAHYAANAHPNNPMHLTSTPIDAGSVSTSGAPTFQPRSEATALNPASASQPSSTTEAPLGLIETPTEPSAYSGYCPIALVTTGQKIKGSTEYAVRHRGRTYLMQSAEAVKQFMQAPDRYSPILSGYDPMIFLESGQLVEGVLEHALHDPASGTVILFASSESQVRFKADTARNAKALSYILSAAMRK